MGTSVSPWSEARLKRVRALDSSGWRQDAEAFAEYSQASLDMCNGHLRAAAAPAQLGLEAGEAAAVVAESRRALSQARLHLRGVVKTAQDERGNHFDEAMPALFAQMVHCLDQVVKAEEAAAPPSK